MNKGRLSHVLHAVHCEPWLIRPQMHATIAAIVDAHAAGTVDHKALAVEFPGQMEELKPDYDDDVAIVPINGVIGKGVGMLEKMSGMTDVEDVDAIMDDLAADTNIRAIVLSVNSPGGTVSGVPELAAKVAAINAVKPVITHTGDMCASAAYWIGSQACHFMGQPSATVGSIGVYLPIMDRSQQYAAAGIKPVVVKAGKYKGAGIPGTTLSEDQMGQLQDRVDYIHGMFKAAVVGARQSMSEEDMQGQDFIGQQALDHKLIDTFGTLSQAVKQARDIANYRSK